MFLVLAKQSRRIVVLLPFTIFIYDLLGKCIRDAQVWSPSSYKEKQKNQKEKRRPHRVSTKHVSTMSPASAYHIIASTTKLTYPTLTHSYLSSCCHPCHPDGLLSKNTMKVDGVVRGRALYFTATLAGLPFPLLMIQVICMSHC